jgi:hypothetical protein
MEQICQTLTASPTKNDMANFFTYDRATFAAVSRLISTIAMSPM